MTIPPDIIERARAVSIASASAGLHLRREGGELVGPCPQCGDGGKGRRSDRFRVTPSRGLFSCRRCHAAGDVIALARLVHGLDFTAAVEWLTGERLTSGPQKPVAAPRPRPATAPVRHDTPAGGLFAVGRTWREAVPIAGTPGADWLRTVRGIDLSAAPDDAGLRFHPRCPYGESRPVPAIVARFTDILTGAERGIHRRAITAGIEPKTMMLGPCGGAVVRLWPDEDVTQGLVLGEGIETTLAAATRITHRGALLQPAWACGSAGTMEKFPVLPGIDALTILVDADANEAGQRAAEQCAERWYHAGREVELLTPNDVGTDFNDFTKGAA